MAKRGTSQPWSLYDGRYVYVMSTENKAAANCSITVNAQEEAKDERGVNVVVFSDESQNIISSLCFDVDVGAFVRSEAFNEEFIRKPSCARIDVRNKGTCMNGVEVIDISDSRAKVGGTMLVEKQQWAAAKVQCRQPGIQLECTGTGKLIISLKGEEVRDSKGGRIPIYGSTTQSSL